MSKFSGALSAVLEISKDRPSVLQWTRTGFVQGTWGAYENFESLVFTQELQSKLQKLALGFLSAQEICAKARVPWRRGAFVWGPAGGGKTAASRAVALLLGWQHITIASSEIHDTHALTRALHDVLNQPLSVVVLENVDEVLSRIDVAAFLDVFDNVSDRAEGVFWVATTRNPEIVPKSQLVRPGRFDDSIRVANPSSEVKAKFYEAHIEPILRGVGVDIGAFKADHLAILEANAAISYAHLNEMRVLTARVLMDGDPSRLGPELQTFCQEQLIGSDRSGGRSAQATELDERVKLVDPRHLLSALQVTDAFKRIVELTVTSATDALTAATVEQKK